MRTVVLLIVIIMVPALAMAVEIVDQQQTVTDYGYWFEQEIPRWQEFFPTLDNISAVGLYIYKAGAPGDIIVQIRNPQDSVLGQAIFPGTTPHNFGWLRVNFSALISLVPQQSYRIYVFSSQPSPNPNNRYFWEGYTNSTYPGNSSVETTFDFAFITYGYSGTGIDDLSGTVPREFQLFQNFPNPFNGNTQIKYTIPHLCRVTIDIYDIRGNLTTTLVDEIQDAGEHTALWSSQESNSGVYFYRIKAGDYNQTKKAVIIK